MEDLTIIVIDQLRRRESLACLDIPSQIYSLAGEHESGTHGRESLACLDIPSQIYSLAGEHESGNPRCDERYHHSRLAEHCLISNSFKFISSKQLSNHSTI